MKRSSPCVRLTSNSVWKRGLPDETWLLLWAFVLVLPNARWMALDASVWSWDPSWYGDNAVNLWWQLVHAPSRWPAAMVHAFGSKAPGVAWLGQLFVPFARLTGSVDLALLLSVLCTQAVALWLLGSSIRRLFAEGKLACILVPAWAAGTTLFVSMGRHFMVESLQLMAVTACYWVAINARQWRRTPATAHLVLAVSIAMAAKITSPAYIVGPVVVALWEILRPGAHHRTDGVAGWRLAVLVSMAGLVFLITAFWYAVNFKTVLAFAKTATSSEIALHYGFIRPFGEKFTYWARAAFYAFSFPPMGSAVLVAAGIGAFALAWTRFIRCHRVMNKPQGIMLVIALLQLVLLLLIFSSCLNEDSRYLLPLLPAVGIVLGWLFSGLRVIPLQIAVLLLCLTQWGMVNLPSNNPEPADSEAKFSWLARPRLDARCKNDVTRAVTWINERAQPDELVLFGIDALWLNNSTFAFYDAKVGLLTGRRVTYGSLFRLDKERVKKALDTLERTPPALFVSLDPARLEPDDDFARPLLERIQHDPLYERAPFESDEGIVIYCRRDACQQRFR